MELLPPVFDHGHLESLLPTRSLSCSDTFVLLSGLLRVDSIFFLPVIDFTHSGSAPFLQGFSKPGLFPVVLDHASVGISLSIRCLQCLDFTMPTSGSVRLALIMLAPDLAHPGVLLPTQSSAQSDAVPSTCSFSRIGSLPAVPDPALIGFPIFLQSFACLESASFVLDLSVFGSFTSIQSHSWIDLTIFVLGLTCVGFVSLLFALDSTTLESPLPVQSPA